MYKKKSLYNHNITVTVTIIILARIRAQFSNLGNLIAELSLSNLQSRTDITLSMHATKFKYCNFVTYTNYLKMSFKLFNRQGVEAI